MTENKLEAKTFHQAIAHDELTGSKCQDCGFVSVPQRYICPKCHSAKVEKQLLSGKGILETYTVIYCPPTSMEAAGYDMKNPYLVGIVKLDEGPSISAQVVDVDLQSPAKIKIGQPLQFAAIERGSNGGSQKVLAFRPA
ncbi:MAG TPA: Zn-ribbon domain-containing OB-fold protein [Bellilinea sp.]|nr:Zn-ribbon domain-containing OB-fold protein [Bellilinea sp.]